MKNRFKKISYLLAITAPLALFSCGGGESTETADALGDVQSDLESALEDVKEEITAETEDGWELFTSDAGGFSVEMPGTPNEQSQTQPTAVGNIEIHMFMLQQGEEELYMVGYNDMPAELIEGLSEDDIKGMLQGGKQGALTVLSQYGDETTAIE
jgi:hypothetical protein